MNVYIMKVKNEFKYQVHDWPDFMIDRVKSDFWLGGGGWDTWLIDLFIFNVRVKLIFLENVKFKINFENQIQSWLNTTNEN